MILYENNLLCLFDGKNRVSGNSVWIYMIFTSVCKACLIQQHV